MARARRSADRRGAAPSPLWGLTLVLAEIAERLERERADERSEQRRGRHPAATGVAEDPR